MRRLSTFILFSIILSLGSQAQNLDSLLLEDLKNLDSKFEIKLNTVISTLSEEASQQQKAYDSLHILHQEAVKRINDLEKSIVVENEKTRGSLEYRANLLEKLLGKRNKKNKIAIVIQYILFGILFMLIFYLLVILRISRRESIEYLLSQTDGLREQNYEILERAEELKKIKKTLKGLIKEQKRKVKASKKFKKKK